VSYTWGVDPVFSQDLMCGNGQRKILITKLVEDMLRRLRKPTRIRYLWIDAICLDQADLVEKSVQISQMGDIFRQSRKTHIYLSTCVLTPTTVNLFHHAKLLDDNDPVDKMYLSDGEYSEDMGLNRTTISRGEQSEDMIYDQTHRAIFQLMQDPWFRRRWVLQEAQLGHNPVLRTRGESLPWSDFTQVVARFVGRPGSSSLDGGETSSVAYPMRVVKAIAEQSGDEACHARDIIHLLHEFHESECSDPRDRVYSLYNMASERLKLPGVDYTASYVELYMRIFLSRINSSFDIGHSFGA
jgi:hypothetical protein